MTTADITAEQGTELVNNVKELVGALPEDAQEKAAEIISRFADGATFGDLYGLDADRLEAVYSVAHNMYGNGKFDDALTMFRFLSLMNYADIRHWMGLGATLQMLNRYEDAVEAFAFATFLDIDNPKPQLQAGYCLMQLGLYHEARMALEAVLMIDDLDATFEIQAEALLNRLEAEEEHTAN